SIPPYIRPFLCALPYWIICVSFFPVGRAFATSLGYYLESAASFNARSATICHCGVRRAACECAELQPTRLPLQFRCEQSGYIILSALRRRQSFQTADRCAKDPTSDLSASCRKCGSLEFWRKLQVVEAPIRVRLS